MNTEIYIEDYRLDVYKDLSALLNFVIDDIKDFSARSTTWSQTIVLPGTANNNKQFGHIFEIGQANTYDPDLPNVAFNFNASKGANCIIFQDNIQTFKGTLRLLEIISDKGQIEYEVAVFGELSALNVKLSSGYLDELDFSAYDHLYTVANIVASWDNVPGSGYTYPHIDYGTYSTLKKNWKYGTFRPALYVKEYVDKIFEAAEFRYESDLFETDRFKGLIIPNNRKDLQKVSSDYLNVNGIGSYTGTTSYNIAFANIVTLGNFLQTSTSLYTYNASDTATGSIHLTMNLSYTKLTTQLVFIYINVNGVMVKSDFINYGTTSGTKLVDITADGISITAGDQIRVVIFGGGDGSNFSIVVNSANMAFSRTGANIVVPVGLNETFSMNYNLPKGVRQIDFIVSLVKLFNLYVYEDKFDSRLIYIKPYVDFYDNSEIVDWTYKLNRNKPVRIKPMSELNAKIYEFKYKPDSDYYNDLYKKRYGQDYGNFVFDSEYEFAEQKNSLELIFSPTPLVGWQNEDKVFSTIFKQTGGTAAGEETTDSNIRILQAKKVTGVASWTILNGATVVSTQTVYMYAGHLNDPDAPSDDLNFGAPGELFFTLAAGNLSVNHFNVYWSEYMADITDKDSKLVTGNFYLTPKDIFDLDFSKYIQIDGVTFRLNKIEDYNASSPDDCVVELLKVSIVPVGSQIDFDIWSQDGDNLVDDGSMNDIQITG